MEKGEGEPKFGPGSFEFNEVTINQNSQVFKCIYTTVNIIYV